MRSRPSWGARGEDYALERVPDSGRKALGQVVQTTLAIPTALVFLATGGALWSAYGTAPLVIGILCAIVIIGFAGFVLTSLACDAGLDSDMLSIWAGYGARGSALTSLIYGGNFVVLFALEAQIIAHAVMARYADASRSLVLAVVGVIVLTLTAPGIVRLSRVSAVTLPLVVALFAWIAVTAPRSGSAHEFWTFQGAADHAGVPAVLAVVAALMAFVVNATVGADVGRYLRAADRQRGAALIGVGLQAVCFGGVMMFGAWLTFRVGGTDPGSYLVQVAGLAGLLCVVVSQVRINMINAYAGSLALSNFGLRSVGLRPGRHIWAIVLVTGGICLALADIYSRMLDVLTFEAVFVAAWTSTLVTYAIMASRSRRDAARSAPISRLSGNQRSVVALVLALACGVPLAFGAFGELGKALAPFVAIAVGACGVWLGARESAPAL